MQQRVRYKAGSLERLAFSDTPRTNDCEEPVRGDELVPGATILWHPDRCRVGEVALFPELLAGGTVHLSRLEPLFARRRGRTESPPEARPLAELHVSRQPLILRSGTAAWSIQLDLATSPTRIETFPACDHGSFSATQIEHGVVLLLSRRVTLLLHCLPLAPEPEPELGLVGDSEAINRLRRDLLVLADLEAPVLLHGETGTGKELVAQALHRAGLRRDAPFLAANMGAIPPSLAAAELFGAARGSFTGADREKKGLFRAAHRGTLLLDEIGETPLEVQVVLLRALEDGAIRPVGGLEPQPVDVRVLAATDADLTAAIHAGRFRRPLLHRLSAYVLRLPALRERRDDIGRLLSHFLTRELALLPDALRSEPLHPRLHPLAELVAHLAVYSWPGNVRQLVNVARRLALWCRHGGRNWPRKAVVGLLEELLDDPPATATPTVPQPPESNGRPGRRRFRKPAEVGEKELTEALRQHAWNPKPASIALGISKATLYRRIDESPTLRQASDLPREEIDEALKRHGYDAAAVAADLEVSLQGLKRRMTALGISYRWAQS